MIHSSWHKDLVAVEIDPAFAARASAIFSAIEQKKPKKVLDAGCGRGYYVGALTHFPFIQKIVGVDVNKTYLSKAKKLIKDKRVTLIHGSLYKLPFPDNYFDTIICSEVLEHLEKDTEGVKELRRVLKKGGVLLATVPHIQFPLLWDPINWILMRAFGTHINKNIWWLAGIWADHERLYSKHDFVKLLKKGGFSSTHTQEFISFCWPFSHFFLYAVGKNLVERFGVETFNRFSKKSSALPSLLLSRFMSVPQRLLKKIRSDSSVILFAHAKK